MATPKIEIEMNGALDVSGSLQEEYRDTSPSPDSERHQKVWNKHFTPLTDPVKHDKTVVLLLSWAEGDLDVSPEVDDLEAAFRDDFHFQTRKEKIIAGKNPQLEINAILVTFIREFNDEHTLCIIYYAGHGWEEHRGEAGSQFFLSGNTAQGPQKQPKLNNVAWKSAEQSLHDADADILLIFDCCFAGALQGRAPARSFEFLGACRRHEMTEEPGPGSFTTAMIWALGCLKNSRAGFDSETLRRKILEAPRFPRAQEPVLFHRLAPHDEQHVWITPLKKGGEAPRGGPQNKKDHNPVFEHIHLQFHFNRHQTDDDLAKLAADLHDYAKNKARALGLKRVSLSKKVNPAADIAQRWKDITNSNRKNKHDTRLAAPPAVVVPMTPPPDAIALTGPVKRSRESDKMQVPEHSDKRKRRSPSRDR